MRKGLKKFLCIVTAATLVSSALSFTACGYTFTPPKGGPEAQAEVTSNGGFAVKKGDYIYFINGVETYTSDNEYGTPQKGSLMRIKAEDADKGTNTAETVIPSLMVAGDYTAGLFIYGDRIYYATPNNMKNTSGVVENTYLDFKSAKLDGTDIQDYFYVSDNTTQYRYVEVDGTVYLLYAGTVKKASSTSDVSALLSYNTKTDTTTELVSGYLEFMFNSFSKEDPWIYYTMSVPNEAGSQDGTSTLQFSYQQLFRVRADWTAEKAAGAYDAKAPYKYTWTEKFLEATEGEAPYSNLGEIVLDGRGALSGAPTQYNHSASEPLSESFGYTYTLRSYTDDGVYFTRADGGSDADTYLYFLPEASLASGWDSVTGNADAKLEKVSVGDKTTGAEIYFIEKDAENKNVHHYLCVTDGEIHNITAANDGSVASDVRIATDVSGATLKFIDNTSSNDYKYVYYTKSNGSGTSVERAVYNGEADNYKNLSFDGENNDEWRAVKLLDVQHATGWYDFEIIGGTVFYADAATVGAASYNYVTAVNIKNADGTLKNNAELAAFNEKYNEIMGTDGLVQTLSSNSNSKLSALISYYFKTGETSAYEDNLTEAQENGRSDTYLFTEAEKTAFKAFVENKGDTSDDALFTADSYKDGDKYYRTYSYFATRIGKVNEEDAEAMALAWRNAIQRDAAPEETEETGLAGWEIALIVIACVIAVGGGAGLAVYFILRKRKKENAPAPERMKVDTTDDRSVNVYDAPEEPEPEALAEPIETTEPAEEAVPAEEATPAEAAEPATPAEEAPVEPAAPTETAEPATPAEEAPVEPAAPTETAEPAEPSAKD